MDNFSDFYHHLAAKSIIVHKLITKNVNFHILFLFLFLPSTLAIDCKCSLNNKSKIKGISLGSKWSKFLFCCNHPPHKKKRKIRFLGTIIMKV